MPEKILVLTTTFPRWKDDVRPEFVYDLSKKLLVKGMEIVVLAPHYPGAKRFEVMEGIKVYRYRYFLPERFQRLVYGGGVLPNLRESWLAKLQAPLLLISGLYSAGKVVRKEHIDIVHSHWIVPAGLAGAVCKRFFKVRHVVTLHGAGLFALEKLPAGRAIGRQILKNTDGVTVVSEHIKNRFLQFFDGTLPDQLNSIAVLPMGIDSGAFNENIDKDELKNRYGLTAKKIMLFIGRIVDKKGLAYLIEAMPKIVSVCPDTHLIICGDGPLRKDLEKIAESMGLSDAVSFKGYISKNEKQDYLHMADILVVPSIVTDSGDMEGLPVVLLEGLASGLPVIATDVGGMKDAIDSGRNGFLVPQKDPRSISARAIEILNDSKLAGSLSENARISAERFDWDTISEQYKRILEGVE